MGEEGWMNYVVEKLSETERVFGAENWTNYALEKLRETESEMGLGEWFSCVLEKLKQFLYVLQHLQIKHWVQVAAPYVIITAVVLLILFCCPGVLPLLFRFVEMLFRFFISFVQMLFRFCISFVRGGGTVVKMMVAPGTKGACMIARATFEAAPKAYFLALRATGKFESVLCTLEDVVNDAPKAGEFLGHIFAKFISEKGASIFRNRAIDI